MAAGGPCTEVSPAPQRPLVAAPQNRLGVLLSDREHPCSPAGGSQREESWACSWTWTCAWSRPRPSRVIHRRTPSSQRLCGPSPPRHSRSRPDWSGGPAGSIPADSPPPHTDSGPSPGETPPPTPFSQFNWLELREGRSHDPRGHSFRVSEAGVEEAVGGAGRHPQLSPSACGCSIRRTWVKGKWPRLPLHSPSHWPFTLILVTVTRSPT